MEGCFFFSTSLLLLVVAAILPSRVASYKENRFVMLAFSQMTGAAPANGTACRAAMTVAVNAVNNLTNILPDYFIELEHRDEMGGFASPKAVINFGRRFDIQATLPKCTEYQSPVIFGNTITFGCQSTGRFLHRVGLVSVTSGCNAPSMTMSRTQYPNIYRSRASGELGVNARMQFITKIGKWKEIAIITHAQNSMDYYIAKVLFKEAQSAGVKVVYFDSVYDFTDEVMQGLKASDARVIAVETNQNGYMNRFVCQSYKNGLTGTRYLFIAPNNGFMDPKLLPDNIPGNPGCTRQMMMEQYKLFYWTGAFTQMLEGSGLEDQIGELGYSLRGFEQRYNALTRGARDLDYSSRHACHDTTVQALLTLDIADKKLKQQNMSLLTFADNPQAVMRVVNESAGKVVFKSLRIPESKYSERLEKDFEPQTITYWYYNDSTYRTIAVLKCNETVESVMNFESYKITMLRPPMWVTPDGQPPREKWLLQVVLDEVPITIFGIVLSIAIIVSVIQLVCAIFIAWYSGEANVANKLPFSKCFFALGCLMVNSGAVLYSLEVTNRDFCTFPYYAVAVGMALINGYLLTKMILYCMRCKSRTPPAATPATKTAIIATTRRRSSQQRVSGDANIPGTRVWEVSIFDTTLSLKFLDGAIIGGSIFFAVLNAAGVAIWQGIDSYRFAVQRASPVYHYGIDTFIIKESNSCALDQSFSWIIIPACHLFLSAVSSIMAFQLRASPCACRAPEFNIIRAAVANETMLSYGTIIIILILNNYQMRQIVMAFASLIVSGTTSAIVLLSTVLAGRHGFPPEAQRKESRTVGNEAI